MTGESVRRARRSTAYGSREGYMEGTAVRQMSTRDTQRQSGRRRRSAAPQPETTARRRRARVQKTAGKQNTSSRAKNGDSKRIMKNREKATRINRGFVVFLTVICVAVMFSAIQYLQLKSEVTTLIETVAGKESELSRLKEENNTMQNELSASVDLNAIKREAMDRLGMRFPSDEQNETYETSRGSFVRQYQDVPE